jgi:hypothetical protein
MPVVKKGDDEYHVIFSGVKDTGLCGKYWADMNQLPTKRQRKSLVPTQVHNLVTKSGKILAATLILNQS